MEYKKDPVNKIEQHVLVRGYCNMDHLNHCCSGTLLAADK